MMHKLNLNFNDWSDFVEFVKKHRDVINQFSDEENFAYKLQEAARINEQFPEYFSFTPEQFNQMSQQDASGFSDLLQDRRVTHKRINDTGENE